MPDDDIEGYVAVRVTPRPPNVAGISDDKDKEPPLVMVTLQNFIDIAEYLAVLGSPDQLVSIDIRDANGDIVMVCGLHRGPTVLEFSLIRQVDLPFSPRPIDLPGWSSAEEEE